MCVCVCVCVCRCVGVCVCVCVCVFTTKCTCFRAFCQRQLNLLFLKPEAERSAPTLLFILRQLSPKAWIAAKMHQTSGRRRRWRGRGKKERVNDRIIEFRHF